MDRPTKHVRTNADPRRRYALHLTKASDTSIVHPARLDPRRSAQVCGQCHSFWEFEDQAAERAANARGLPYRPGDDLRQTRFIVQPTVEAGSAIIQRFLQDDPDSSAICSGPMAWSAPPAASTTRCSSRPATRTRRTIATR
jgi:hypothetical protein